MQKYSEQDNDWAFDVKEDPIHISLAESGAKGYFCMGCRKEMQAVKKKNQKHKSYFRHHVKDIDKSKTECVYSSRVYREKLAADYFHRVKEIKLPAVYKYPPRGVDGLPYLLEDTQLLKARSTKSELTFYENEDGEVKWGKNPEIDERYLLVRPDMVFFNEAGKPILFLEFVITHKPDADKLSKLKRLGINTVQIIVPKLPAEEIEKSISKVSKTKWVYHEIESNTEYLPISNRNSEGVPSIDEEQRKLFEESYKCRAAQLGNLVRAINRSLESQSYKRAERNFEQEISRIEEATRNHQSRLDEIQDGIEGEIYSELDHRREILDYRRERFRKYSTDLEGKYHKERERLRKEEEDTDREIRFRHGGGRTENDVRKEFERTEREYNYQETNIDSEQEVIRRQEKEIIRNIEENTAFENNFAGEQESLRREFEFFEKKEQENFERIREDLESKISRYREFKAEVEIGIRSEFEREYEQIIERVNNRDLQGGDELSERIKSILELRGLFGSYTNGKEALERYRKGIQYIKDGTWKKWN